jgi:hypothetical protein
MNIQEFSKYKKALVVGTGGGNDIVSATLVADYLSKSGLECDVAGVLSPGAVHEFDGSLEKVVNKLGGDVRRYINSRDRKEISFIDSILPSLAKEKGYSVGSFYDFSLKYGTEKLVEGVNGLIEKNDYDLFLEVDVGGDILGRKNVDNHLLSPLMDFTSLYVLDKVPVDSYLVQFGLGTDGELRPDGIKEILKEMKQKDVLLAESEIDNSDSEVERFRGLFSEIGKMRLGHTATMTLETLDNKGNGDVESVYYSSWKVGDRLWRNNYDVVLLKDTFGKVYVFDGRKLPSLRSETAIPYENALEQFVKMKSSPEWKTELDLCYTKTESDEYVYHLTPSLNVPSEMRNEIIIEGLKDLERGNSDKILMLNRDSDLIPKDYFVFDIGNFSLVSLNDIDSENSLVKKIKRYSEKAE